MKIIKKRYLLECILFILGIILFKLEIINLFSSILLFFYGFRVIKDGVNYINKKSINNSNNIIYNKVDSNKEDNYIVNNNISYSNNKIKKRVRKK